MDDEILLEIKRSDETGLVEKHFYSTVVSTEEVTNVLPLRVFPNPTSAEVQVVTSLPKGTIGVCIIANTLGQVLWQQEVQGTGGEQTLVCDAVIWPQGLYYVSVSTREARAYKVLTVLR